MENKLNIQIDEKELKSISYNIGLEELAKCLENELSINFNDNIELDDVVESLKKINMNDLSEDNIKNILLAIKRYKVICNLNDPEKRTSNTLNMFIKDIYKDSLHFFLEIIQNADDACKGGQEHTLTIEFTKDSDLIFEYDERGFNFLDLFAITSVGNSSKKVDLSKSADESDIGEKGIGFKSIFSVVEQVKIQSKYFGFDIVCEENNLKSILEPKNITLDKNNKTRLTLILKEEYKSNKENIDRIKNWLDENILHKGIDSPFLFIKNFKKINYNGNVINIEREKLADDFYLISIGENKYIKYKQNMEFSKQEIISRWKYLENEINNEQFTLNRPMEICFPLNIQNYDNKNGKVYSYLPTNIQINFPIFLNLDVHLTASRGNITKEDFVDGSLWNQKIENRLGEFLTNAYKKSIDFIEQNVNEIEILQTFRDFFYEYIPKNKLYCKDNANTYTKAYETFFDNIQKENLRLFLNYEKKFVKINEICFIDEVHLPVLGQIYDFIGEENLKQYATTYEWNEFLNSFSGSNNKNKKNVIDIVFTDFNSVVNYWSKKVEEAENLKENIDIDIDKHFKDTYNTINLIYKLLTEDYNKITNQKDKESYHLLAQCTLFIPVETNNEYGFEILSKSNIDDLDKVLFLHAGNSEIENSENAMFVFEEYFPNIKKLIETLNFAEKFNLLEYLKNNIKNLKDELELDDIKQFVENTIKFYKEDPNCYNGFYQDNNCENARNKIKNILRNYTFDLNVINSNEFEQIMSQNKINKEYMLKLHNTSIEKYNINCSENLTAYIKYLIFLGIKIGIEFIDNDIDKYSKTICDDININYCLTEKNKLEFCSLGKYCLEKLQENLNNISDDNLKKISFIKNILEYFTNKILLFRKDIYNIKEYTQFSKDDIFYLINEVYILKNCKVLSDCEINTEYNKNNEIDKFLDYLGIQDIKNYPIREQFAKFAVFTNEEIVENIIELDENNHTDNMKYLIKSNLKNSEILIEILKINNIRVSIVQKREIKDFFGENQTECKIPDSINFKGDFIYCDGIFFKEHLDNLKNININSIWDKEILKDLCQPLKIKNSDKVMEGYGYTCPICGSKSHSGLSGLRFKRFKHSGDSNIKNLYIAACLNCMSTLEYAKQISIKDFDEILKHFSDTCYCADKNHIKNNAVMKTVDLEIVTFDDTKLNLQMKISYLNMCIYFLLA